MELYNYRHAKVALAGNRDAEDVLKRKGFSGPIRIIPQFGFDTDIYKRTEPRKPRSPGDPFILGFVGRIKDSKGLDLLIDALAQLPEILPSSLCRQRADARRTRAAGGTPGSYGARHLSRRRADLRNSTSDAGVGCVGTAISDAPQLDRTIRAHLAEAMSCETPVIGSRSGEIPYVIDDAGLTFEEGNVQELVACVRKLIDDPELYAMLAKKGRQRVLENYTQERIAQQTFEVYKE